MRTVQDLLAERRANVIEAANEPDLIGKEMLLYHIGLLDWEISLARNCAPRAERLLQ